MNNNWYDWEYEFDEKNQPRIHNGDKSSIAADHWNRYPEDIKLEIVYEDRELLVVNKPAGMVVHPAPGARHGTLVNALLLPFNFVGPIACRTAIWFTVLCIMACVI